MVRGAETPRAADRSTLCEFCALSVSRPADYFRRMLGGSSALAPLLIVVSPPTLDLLSHQLKVLLRPVDTY